MGNESSTQAVTLRPHQEAAAPCPDPREAHAACAFRDELWVVGGAHGESLELLSAAWVWSPSSKTWRKINLDGPVPVPRAAQGYSFVAPHFLVLVGGTTPASGWLSEVCVLDLSQQKWIPISTTCSTPGSEGEGPSPRDKTACCSAGSKMYMMGGFGPRDAATKASDRVEDSVPREEEHAGAGEEEEEEEDRDAVGVQGHTDVGDDEEDTGNPDERPHVEGADGKKLDLGWSDELWELDSATSPAVLQWRLMSKGTGPTPRAAAAMCALNGKLFIFGGRDAVERRNDLWSYSLTASATLPAASTPSVPASAWQRIDTQSILPPARSFHTVTAVGARNLLLFGGLNLVGTSLRDFHLFDVETWNWIQPTIEHTPPADANALPARGFLSCTVLDAPKLAMLFGGSNGAQESPVYFADLISISIDPILNPVPAAVATAPAAALSAAPKQQRITLPTGGEVPSLLAKPVASNVSAAALFPPSKPVTALASHSDVAGPVALGAVIPVLPPVWKPAAENPANTTPTRRAEGDVPDGAPGPASKKAK